MSYHLTRKPLSVVKAVLHQNCSQITPNSDVPADQMNWCDWAPFGKLNFIQCRVKLNDKSYLVWLKFN